jgi:hypothetical protein
LRTLTQVIDQCKPLLAELGFTLDMDGFVTLLALVSVVV